MRRFFAVVALAGCAAVAALLLLPLGAGASSHHRLVVAINGTFSFGDTPSGSGSFILDGAVSDRGTFTSPFSATPGKDKCLNVAAEWMFTGSKGRLTLRGTGTSCSFQEGDERAVSDFKVSVAGGTEAYAGLAGSGTATGALDIPTSSFTTVFDLAVTQSH